MKALIISLCFISNLAIANTLSIADQKIRLAPPGSTTTAMYLNIKNSTKDEVNLLKVTSEISDTIEIHEMKMGNGKMEMREIDKLPIHANSEVVLKPGGLHIMIFNLKKGIKENDQLKFTFFFSNNEKIESTIPVVKLD